MEVEPADDFIERRVPVDNAEVRKIRKVVASLLRVPPVGIVAVVLAIFADGARIEHLWALNLEVRHMLELALSGCLEHND